MRTLLHTLLLLGILIVGIGGCSEQPRNTPPQDPTPKDNKPDKQGLKKVNPA